MKYLDAILWYSAWPILIFISYKFVEYNIKSFSKKEKLKKSSKKRA